MLSIGFAGRGRWDKTELRVSSSGVGIGVWFADGPRLSFVTQVGRHRALDSPASKRKPGLAFHPGKTRRWYGMEVQCRRLFTTLGGLAQDWLQSTLHCAQSAGMSMDCWNFKKSITSEVTFGKRSPTKGRGHLPSGDRDGTGPDGTGRDWTRSDGIGRDRTGSDGIGRDRRAVYMSIFSYSQMRE